MNKARRKKLDDVRGTLASIAEAVRDLQQEEQDAFDAMPESLQESERGEAAANAASELEDAVSNLESAIENIENATGA